MCTLPHIKKNIENLIVQQRLYSWNRSKVSPRLKPSAKVIRGDSQNGTDHYADRADWLTLRSTKMQARVPRTRRSLLRKSKKRKKERLKEKETKSREKEMGGTKLSINWRHATQIKRRPLQSGRKYRNCSSCANLPPLSIILINPSASKGNVIIARVYCRREKLTEEEWKLAGRGSLERERERERERETSVKSNARRGLARARVFPRTGEKPNSEEWNRVRGERERERERGEEQGHG